MTAVCVSLAIVSVTAATYGGPGKVCCIVDENTDQDRPAGACQACICRSHNGDCVIDHIDYQYTVNHYAEKRFTMSFVGCVTDPSSCCKRVAETVQCAYHRDYGDIFNNDTEPPICNTIVCEPEYSETNTCESETCAS